MKQKISSSTLKGFSRIFDIAGNLREWPDIENDKEKDYQALRSDWENVGKAIEGAINTAK